MCNPLLFVGAFVHIWHGVPHYLNYYRLQVFYLGLKLPPLNGLGLNDLLDVFPFRDGEA